VVVVVAVEIVVVVVEGFAVGKFDQDIVRE
jgi:hypothetical protein